MKAMILAAGRGSRLKELTKSTPKPLMKLTEDLTYIDFTIQRLMDFGINKFVINVCYLGEQIIDHVDRKYQNCDFTFFKEDNLLGTGGAIANAKDALLRDNDECIIVINSDIIHFLDFEKILNQHKRSCSIASLIVKKDNKRERALLYNNSEGLTGINDSKGNLLFGLTHKAKPDDTTCGFTGIHIINKELIENLEQGIYSIIEVYAKQVKKGNKINIIPLKDELWMDLGTKNRMEIGKKLILTLIKNSSLIGDLKKIFIKTLRKGAANKLSLRIISKQKSNILILNTEKKEVNIWKYITKFLRNSEFNVPKVHSSGEDWFIMEDCGKKTLLDKVQENQHITDQIKKIYYNALDIICDLSKIETTGFPLEYCSPVKIYKLGDVKFDIKLFNEHCLNFALNETCIEELCEFIYKEIDKDSLCIMHRDFQSTNILIKDSVLKVVDISTIRLGYNIYDAVSLIFDSYIPFDKEFINDMKEYYFKKRSLSKEFEKVFWIAAFLRITHDIAVFKILFTENEFFVDKIEKANKRLKYIMTKINLNQNVNEKILDFLDNS